MNTLLEKLATLLTQLEDSTMVQELASDSVKDLRQEIEELIVPEEPDEIIVGEAETTRIVDLWEQQQEAVARYQLHSQELYEVAAKVFTADLRLQDALNYLKESLEVPEGWAYRLPPPEGETSTFYREEEEEKNDG